MTRPWISTIRRNSRSFTTSTTSFPLQAPSYRIGGLGHVSLLLPTVSVVVHLSPRSRPMSTPYHDYCILSFPQPSRSSRLSSVFPIQFAIISPTTFTPTRRNYRADNDQSRTVLYCHLLTTQRSPRRPSTYRPPRRANVGSMVP